MTTSSTASFIDNLRDSRLLQAGQIDELLRTPDAQEVDPATLGQCLVQLGWLSPFQLDEISQGRGGGLTLAPYRLVEKLGENATGTTYKAHHQDREGTLVVRILRPERLMSGPAQDRLLRITTIAGTLQHSALARTQGVEAAGDQVAYVREYVDGIDVARLVQEQGALPVAQACDYVEQAAAALQAIHDQNLTHGRVHAHNLIATMGGAILPASGGRFTAKLVDLGIGGLDEPVPAPVGRDIADLGRLFAQMLSGGGESIPESVPEPVRDVQRRMLARISDGGFGSAAEVAAALAPHGTPAPMPLVEPPAPTVEEPAPMAEELPSVTETTPIPEAPPALEVPEPPPPAPAVADPLPLPVPPAPIVPPAAEFTSDPGLANPFTATAPATTSTAFADAPLGAPGYADRQADEAPLPPRRKKKYGARFWLLALLGLLLHLFALGIIIIMVFKFMEPKPTLRTPGSGPRAFPTKAKSME